MTGHQRRDWAPPLRAVRESQGKGQRQIARLAGVDPGFYNRLEAGKVQPSIRVLYRLAVALDLRDLARLLKPYIREAER